MPWCPRALLFLLVFALGSSCDFRTEKATPQAQLSGGWYDRVRKEVFAPSCIACHGSSGGVNLETYSSIKQNLAAIERVALVDKTMPRGGSLNPSQLDLLAKWIKAGAPLEAPDPGGPPVDDPLKPTFVSIKKKIFEARCASCHSPEGPGKNVSLASLEDLINSPRELVIPGNPEESGLLIALSRTDAKRMPPPETGGPLPPDQLEVIRSWIHNGAPETDTSGAVVAIDPTALSYALVKDKVLRPRCEACHGNAGGINLETFDSVLAGVSIIQKAALIDRKMPKGGHLLYNEYSLLSAWIKAGAPKNPGDGPSPGGGPPVDPGSLSYAVLRDRIFTPRCISCHGNSGGLNLESYANIQANLGKVAVAVLIDKIMPKNGPLAQVDRDLLAAWIRAGAPEGPGGGPGEPLKPLFSSIQKKILNVRCVTCHNPTGEAKNVPFQTLDDLLKSPRDLVLPGNPDESGLMIAITRMDGKRMPPPATAGPLAAPDIAIIQQWIKEGAKP